MSEIDELRDFVNERLAMAAMEIFGRYEKTFAKWQREICRSSEEKAQDVQQLSLPEATHIKNEQERRTSPGGDQFCLFDVQQLSIPGPPQIKEEPEPMSIQQEEQLHGLQSDTTDFVLVSPRGQTNLNWEHSSQLQPPGHTPTVENRGHSLSTTIIEEPIRLESAEGYSDSPPPFVTPSFPPSLKEEKRGGLLPNLNSLKSSCTQADCLIPSPCSSTGLSLGPSTSPWTRAIPSSGSGSEGKDVSFGVNESMTAKKTYRCEECGKTFSRNYNLVNHKRIHTGVQPYQCEYCGKTYNRKNSLVSHRLTHTAEKPYHCRECGKSFTQRAHLIKHEVFHTGRYQCDLCEKAFSERCSFVRHRRIHTGEKPYQCDKCDKSFNDRSNFVKHRRIHEEEKPFQCEYCGKGYRWQSQLGIHRRMHSRENSKQC